MSISQRDDECAWKCITPDPDIAGIGVTAAFITTSGLSLVFSTIYVLSSLHASDRNVDRWLDKWLRWTFRWIFGRGAQRQRWRQTQTQPDNSRTGVGGDSIATHKARVVRSIFFPVVFSLNDTQLVTGLAILVAGWIQIPTGLSVYHFSIVADLAWLASNTQYAVFSTMRVQRPSHARDWDRDGTMTREGTRGTHAHTNPDGVDSGSDNTLPYISLPSKLLRALCTFAFGVMLFVVSTIQGHGEWYDSFGYPVRCLITDLRNGRIGGEQGRWMVANYLMLMWGYGIVFVRFFVMGLDGYRPIRVAAADKPTNFKGMDVMLGSILPCLKILSHVASLLFRIIWDILDSMALDIAFTSAWFGIGVWTLVLDRRFGRGEFCDDDGGAEGKWGFGQLVPLLMLLIPLLVITDVYGKILADVTTRREAVVQRLDLEAGVER